jgi:hypothetical protein
LIENALPALLGASRDESCFLFTSSVRIDLPANTATSVPCQKMDYNQIAVDLSQYGDSAFVKNVAGAKLEYADLQRIAINTELQLWAQANSTSQLPVEVGVHG